MKNLIIVLILGLSLSGFLMAGDLEVPKVVDSTGGTNIEPSEKNQTLPDTNLDIGKSEANPTSPEDIKKISAPEPPVTENVNGRIVKTPFEEVKVKNIIETPASVETQKESSYPEREIGAAPINPDTMKEPDNSEKSPRQNRARPRETLKRHGEMVK